MGLNTEAQIKISTSSDTSGVDKAKDSVEGFGGSLNRIGEIAAGIGLARLAEQFLEVSKNAAGFAIQTAGTFEQWKVSFDTMLGSSEKASVLLSQISDFAVKTPFELPQVVEGSKRLLAYNIEAEKIIPTFKMLGEIASGVGREKLPQLILAFGQVKAATKLTGAELRQFSEAGVPLLEALVDQANAQGGVLTKVGGISKATASKMASLSSTIADQEFRMKLLTDAGKNNGIQWEMLQHKYDQNKQKLEGFGAAGQEVYTRVKTSAADMIESIKDGAVKFEDVQAALEGMTQKGGKFFELMDKQSKTFDGIVSNIRDNFTRLALEIMGFDMQEGSKTFGEVKEGSIFDKLRNAAEMFLEWMNEHKAEIIHAFEMIGQAINFVIKIIGLFINAYQWLRDNTQVVTSVLTGLAVVTLPLVIAALQALIGMFVTLITVTIPALIVSFGPVLAVFAAVALAVWTLQDVWATNFGNIKGIVEKVVNFVIGSLDWLLDKIQAVINAINGLTTMATGKKLLDIDVSKYKMGSVSFTGSDIASAPAPMASYANASYAPNYNPNKSVVVNNYNSIASSADISSMMKENAWQLKYK